MKNKIASKLITILLSCGSLLGATLPFLGSRFVFEYGDDEEDVYLDAENSIKEKVETVEPIV